jgi:hypothetical protein
LGSLYVTHEDHERRDAIHTKPVIPAQAGIQLEAGGVKPSVRTASLRSELFIRTNGNAGFRFQTVSDQMQSKTGSRPAPG